MPAALRAQWRRAAALRGALATLGQPPLRPAPTLLLSGRDAALGAWYVLKGSRLGGRLIAREARLRLPSQCGVLRAWEGDHVAVRWAAFTTWLDGPAATQDRGEVLDGARNAFAAMDG